MTTAKNPPGFLQRLRAHYLESGDYNGTRVYLSDIPLERLKEMVEKDEIDLIFSTLHPNPFIKAFDADPKEEQLRKLENVDQHPFCAYPSKIDLEKNLPTDYLQDAPFQREVAFGRPVLDFHAFDIRVLEIFLRDPNFECQITDSHGAIRARGSVKDGLAYDNVYLERFGFCFSEKGERAIAVFLWDLIKLPADQQRFWRGYKLSGKFKLHRAFFDTSIRGEWITGCSVFKAICIEISIINQLCGSVGFPPLFHKDFLDGAPSDFRFLIRPTLKEYYEFIHAFDKLISENINKEFFNFTLGRNNTLKRGVTEDGEEITQPIGTLKLLEMWISQYFENKNAVKGIMDPLKEIRRQRQKPAHVEIENKIDASLFDSQREILENAWWALHNIRMFLSNHPSALGFEPPSWYDPSEIWLP